MSSSNPSVLVLGAGINGSAIARELAINGLSVCLVDTADIARGATSGSSRLIHGGLRYLEYGELDLVKESLAERTRLLRLAPQFVRPLRLWIPASNRFGGGVAAVGRFFGWRHWPTSQSSRGVALVRAGLAFYDAYAQDATLPKYHCGRLDAPGAPLVDSHKYRWLCSYSDGQVTYPERLVQAMLADGAHAAREHGQDFRVLNYHQARLDGTQVEITPTSGGGEPQRIQPALVVNATGAWVDETLERLHVPAERLMGGTKGTHLFSFSTRLHEQLAGQGIYAEAGDGRPIFITPLGDTVLIGTTDVPFSGPPEKAQATPDEIDYLLEAVNSILPSARLRRDDVDFHYSAVRPLPYVHAKTTAAITRRHFLVEHSAAAVPIVSIVGGKLTTMRSLAEEMAAKVLEHMGRKPEATSRDRPFPGAENYPHDAAGVTAACSAIGQRTGYTAESVAAVWKLCGTRAEAILAASAEHRLLDGSPLPVPFARHAIATEHARELADLVERRLMLLYHQRLTRVCLEQLADLLVEAGRLPADAREQAVLAEIERLQSHYGKRVITSGVG